MRAIARRLSLSLCLAALLCLGGLPLAQPAAEAQAPYLAYPLLQTRATYPYAIATRTLPGGEAHPVAGDALGCPPGCPFGCVLIIETAR